MANLIRADNGVSSGVTGIVQTADSSGQLALQTTTAGGVATTALTIDNSQKVTFANTIGFGSNAGITFNNSSATVNSTLNDYEIGNYTPADVSGAGLTFTVSVGSYTKIGRFVSVFIYVQFPSTANGNNINISLPFTPYRANGSSDQGYGGSISYTTSSLPISVYILNSTAAFQLYASGGTNKTNAQLSTAQVEITMQYQTSF